MELTVQLSDARYDITVARGALARAGERFALGRRALIVTDDGVPAAYAGAVAAQCGAAHVVTLPQGERSKSFASLEHVLTAMLGHDLTRADCVVAVGGGMAGDLAGLAAALYMRGVDFYNVPTTLLAQVDSSIGGKTAVDLAGVKNIVGAFRQPRAVLIDPDTLRTLPRRQLAAGLAEAIKMAAAGDADLFARLEACADLDAALPEIIVRALAIKKAVVEADPLETGVRRVLNFGHTLGHAIESAAGGALLHGECVAIGMLPMCAPDVRARLTAVLRKYGLPTRTDLTADALSPFLTHDKKARAGGICTVFVPAIGAYEFRDRTPAEILREWEEVG